MKRRWLLLAALLAPIGGCGGEVVAARPEWRVRISTDAPIPSFGDRLLVEVYALDGTVCSGCRREFGVASGSAWPLSFGIVPDGDVARVRARLYRTVLSGPEGPKSDRILDAIAGLPSPDGVTDVDIPLSMTCFGVVADLEGDRSCDPETGALAPVVAHGSATPLDVGSWAPAASAPCAGPAPADMVCVQGGAFLLGDPTFVPVGDLNPIPEQLVQVAPFCLDVAEMTVGGMRALAEQIGSPVPASPGPDDMCTYTTSPGANEDMPVNCVSHQLASAACAALGKRLPTEAEWEWAAGNRTLESPYPWIDGGSPCDEAIVAMGRLQAPPEQDEQFACLGLEAPGPRPGGSPTDLTQLGLRNLAGNVSEWVADDLAAYADESCWGASVALRNNPLCSTGSATRSLRGGSWSGYAFAARVTWRSGAGAAFTSPRIGFRCAR